jgi:hypothetical protein
VTITVSINHRTDIQMYWMSLHVHELSVAVLQKPHTEVLFCNETTNCEQNKDCLILVRSDSDLSAVSGTVPLMRMPVLLVIVCLVVIWQSNGVF